MAAAEMTFSIRSTSPSVLGSWPAARSEAGIHPRLLLSHHEPRWAAAVSEKLNVLCSLQQGWDGYRAKPIRFTTAWFAFKLLENACATDSSAPDLVPGPSGDLQIEWHNDRGDIEIHVKAPNDVNAWRSNMSLGEEGEEIILTNNFTVLKVWINELLEEQFASAA